MDTLLLLTACLAAVSVLLHFVFRPSKSNDPGPALERMNESIRRIESNLKEDFRLSREEAAKTGRENRDELNNSIREFKLELTQLREKLTKDLTDFSARNSELLEKIHRQIDQELKNFTEQGRLNSQEQQNALQREFKRFLENFDKNVESFNNLQREKFAQLDDKQSQLIVSTEKRLEEMRVTVDEKLQKTLSERLGQSFELVGKQLESVQKGLGEMQTIASDVGGLKKVLSNVKLRGGVGEVQLAMLLEQILAPSQYDANVKTKKGSNDPVEFAIKLPGRDAESSHVYLPIDAKFPKDTYELLLNAYENGTPDEIENASKNLEATVKKMAKDICDKYIDPPNTTDFAILFLPFESIYAEVIRRSDLVDQLRNQFKITVAGPTTLAALLNSLQMGFRTLALQKRSSEVWKVLGSVKNEFDKFGGLLDKAQRNIQTGLGQLDDVMGTRTKAIQRQLRQVESLPASEGTPPLPELGLEMTEEDS
jgi:DNA recombination protein RmuC